jgi:hypothetical protein
MLILNNAAQTRICYRSQVEGRQITEFYLICYRSQEAKEGGKKYERTMPTCVAVEFEKTLLPLLCIAAAQLSQDPLEGSTGFALPNVIPRAMDLQFWSLHVGHIP